MKCELPGGGRQGDFEIRRFKFPILNPCLEMWMYKGGGGVGIACVRARWCEQSLSRLDYIMMVKYDRLFGGGIRLYAW